MSKQSDIQVGIKEHLQQCLEVSGLTGLVSKSFADSFSRSLPVLLDGMGVVIKVNGELPEELDVWKEIQGGGYYIGAEALEKAGYVAVEPLIGEE